MNVANDLVPQCGRTSKEHFTKLRLSEGSTTVEGTANVILQTKLLPPTGSASVIPSRK